MNLGIIAAATALVAGGVYFFTKPAQADVYAMPQTEAYQRLANATLPGGKYGVFVSNTPSIPPSISGNGVDEVVWTSPYQQGTSCTLTLSPVDAKATKVAVSCGKADDDVNTSFLTRTQRTKVIEAVDATLTNRSYDPERGERGQTASNWPADTIRHATPADVSAGAMKQLASNMQAMARVERAERATRMGCAYLPDFDSSHTLSSAEQNLIAAAHAKNAQHAECAVFNAPSSPGASQGNNASAWAK